MLIFLTVYKFFQKNFICNINLGGRKRKKIYSPVERQGERERRGKGRKEEKEEEYSSLFDFLTEDFKLKGISFFSYLSLQLPPIQLNYLIFDLYCILYYLIWCMQICKKHFHLFWSCISMLCTLYRVNAFFSGSISRKEEHIICFWKQFEYLWCLFISLEINEGFLSSQNNVHITQSLGKLSISYLN